MNSNNCRQQIRLAGNAAEALGASRMRILMKEIIPNSVSSVLIMATTDIGNKILMFSTLSFLGLGSAPPTPEWGMMVSDGVDYFNKFWVSGFPGLAIFTMAVGANFIGDGLRRPFWQIGIFEKKLSIAKKK